MKNKIIVWFLLVIPVFLLSNVSRNTKLMGIELDVKNALYYFENGNYVKSINAYKKLVDNGLETNYNFSMLGWSYYKLGFANKAFNVFKKITKPKQYILPKSFLSSYPSFSYAFSFANKSPNKNFYTNTINSRYKNIGFWLGVERFLGKSIHRSDFFSGASYQKGFLNLTLRCHNYSGDIKNICPGYTAFTNLNYAFLVSSFVIKPGVSFGYSKFRQSTATCPSVGLNCKYYTWNINTNLSFNKINHNKFNAYYLYSNKWYSYLTSLGKNKTNNILTLELSKFIFNWFNIALQKRWGYEDLYFYNSGYIADDIKTSYSHTQVKLEVYYKMFSMQIGYKVNSNNQKTVFSSLNVAF